MTFSLAIVVGLVGLVYIFMSQVRSQENRTNAINEAKSALASGNADQAIEAYDNLLVTYPNDRVVILGLVKGHTRADNMDEARRYADMLANWHREEKQDLSFKESVYNKIMSYFSSDKESFSREEGYEYILGSIKYYEQNPEIYLELGLEILEINPESPVGIMALALDRMAADETEEAMEHAQRGLKVEPNGRGWHEILAQCYLSTQDWENVVAECEAELEIDPSNENAKSMLRLARRKLSE